MNDDIFFEIKEITPTVLSIKELLDILCNKNRTLIRIGDGEIKLIFNNINIFEKNNEKLGSFIYSLLINQDKTIDIAIGDHFSYYYKEFISTNINLISWNNIWEKQLKQYMIFMMKNNMNLFSLTKKYLNADIFHPYHCCNQNKIDIGNIFNRIKNVFKDKNVLLVTGDPYFKTYKDNENVFNEAASLEIYDTPSKGSFEFHDKILNDLKEKGDKLICMACGPCGKVLAYELQTMHNIRCIDTGHLMRDYHRFVNKIVPFSAEDRMYND